MTDLRWHVDLTARTPAEMRDKIALTDADALRQGWERHAAPEYGEGTAHLVYDRLGSQGGRIPLWVLYVVVIALIVVAALSTGNFSR